MERMLDTKLAALQQFLETKDAKKDTNEDKRHKKLFEYRWLLAMRDRILDGLEVTDKDLRRSTAPASPKSRLGKSVEPHSDDGSKEEREELTLEDFLKIFRFENGVNDITSGHGWTPLAFATLFNYGG